jgi:hypothetical protein
LLFIHIFLNFLPVLRTVLSKKSNLLTATDKFSLVFSHLDSQRTYFMMSNIIKFARTGSRLFSTISSVPVKNFCFVSGGCRPKYLSCTVPINFFYTVQSQKKCAAVSLVPVIYSVVYKNRIPH